MAKAGIIYVLYAPKLGLYKIGKTTNLQQRLKDHRRRIPGGIELIHQIHSDDINTAEWWIQSVARHQAKYKNETEWYRLSPDALQKIMSYDRFDAADLAQLERDVCQRLWDTTYGKLT
ncbi:MAG: GIY-YIG nuclease family protein [Opitutaceae bacterium]|nr:GIY-YIG nuclease family protein [Opitutaceae bacterium]